MKHDVDQSAVLYVYRQTARQAGVGMMIGPPILAAVAIGFAWNLFWPHENIWGPLEYVLAAFLWICSIGFGLIATLFFIIGMRRVIYGGAWGCVIDPDFLTWCYPAHACFKGHSVALHDIRSVQVVAPPMEGDDFEDFIVTDAEKLRIHADCYGRLVPFLRALLQANPAIEVEIIEPGRTRLWRPIRRQIEALCAAARLRQVD